MGDFLPSPERIAAAEQSVREWAANLPVRELYRDPRHESVYRMYSQMKRITFLVVKHADKENSIEVSRDGGPRGHVYLSTKHIIIEPESAGDFIVATYPRWIVNNIRTGDRPVNLLGVSPDLTDDVEWTAEQRKLWRNLQSRAGSINVKIRNSHIRMPQREQGIRSSAFSPW